jgi:hypothetical protein
MIIQKVELVIQWIIRGYQKIHVTKMANALVAQWINMWGNYVNLNVMLRRLVATMVTVTPMQQILIQYVNVIKIILAVVITLIVIVFVIERKPVTDMVNALVNVLQTNVNVILVT